MVGLGLRGYVECSWVDGCGIGCGNGDQRNCGVIQKLWCDMNCLGCHVIQIGCGVLFMYGSWVYHCVETVGVIRTCGIA